MTLTKVFHVLLLIPTRRLRRPQPHRNAQKGAADLAAVLDDEDGSANNFRAHHLGEKHWSGRPGALRQP